MQGEQPASSGRPHSEKNTETLQAASELPPKSWKVGTLTYSTGGLVLLFFWLLWGDFAWSLKERSVSPVMQLLLKKYQASDMLIGLMIGSIPGIISVILGPIISYRSDRHRGRWGRRIPFLLIPTPVVVLSMCGLACSPLLGGYLHRLLGAHSPGLNALVLFFFGVFWMFFEIATVTANTVFGGLVNDVVPQAMMGRFYALFRAFSLIAGMIYFYWLLGSAETHFSAIFLGTAGLYGVGFSLMCFRVREGTYPPPEADPSGGGFFSAAKTYFRECFGNPYYLWFFLAVALSWMAAAPINLFTMVFARSLNMDMGVLGSCVAVTYLISLAASYPLGVLADKFHPLRLGLALQGVIILVTIWGFVSVRDVPTFTVMIVAHGVLSGSWMTAAASLSQRLLPRAKFTQFASALGIATALGTATIGPVVGSILDATHHNYRLTYLASAIITAAALAAGLVLHSRFVALGGPKNYTAPE